MPTSNLCPVLVVLAVVASPVSAAEKVTTTNTSKPVVQKEGTKTIDGPASPTVINEGNLKPQQQPANPKPIKGGGGSAGQAGGAMHSGGGSKQRR